MECKHCSNALKSEDMIKCTACHSIYHYLCVGMSETDFKKILPMNKAKWKCPVCKISKKPCQNISPKLPNTSEKINIISQSQLDIKSLIDHFDDRFNSLHSTMESFKTFITEELKKLSETVSFWSTKIKSVESSINSVVEHMNNLDIEVSRIDKLGTELEEMKIKFKELSDNNNRNEQWVRRSNIQINGVPQKKGENLITIIKTLAEKSGYPLNFNTDVDFVTRVAVKNDTSDNHSRPIILKMQARYKKDDFLSSLRKLKNLKASDIGFPGKNNPIYINDHLSAYNKLLLSEARRRGKDKGYLYCWVRNCTIMVRKTDNSPVIHITSKECLNKIS
ncbi:uncharacterized protein LOC124543894 [Vanessa cardui]|uniref:uncharacterized protein LOC124543894 n=1 Tax=Vanessa cardui TaxID=171605 RepID=UPI001F12CFC7|nr:uncharacterized protein LOC124543894 [Vanessa cardui]